MKLIISLLAPLSIGFIGSYFTADSIADWYTTLKKPFFTPPNWLFAPAWTVLYIMMGVSFYLLWKQKSFADNKNLLKLFLVQFMFNAVWSPVFFGLKSPFLALGVILLLWLCLAALIAKLWKKFRTAAWLLVPYLMWVSYAAALNLAIVWLN